MRALPGDHLVPDPVVETTHAVSIAAPPDRVWPWLVQMGAGRGGWYSYDWIDNGGRRSAESILSGFGTPRPGDILPALPRATNAFIVHDVAENSHLILGLPTVDGTHRATWGLVLEPRRFERSGHRSTGTRLLARARIGELHVGPPTRRVRIPSILLRLGVPPLHYVMQRRQLVGIRDRAERT